MVIYIGNLPAMASEHDLLERFEQYGSVTTVNIMTDEKDVLKLLYKTIDGSDQTVADYMKTEVVALDASATLTDLCDCLIDGSFRSVPLTEDGKLCAIASTSDAIQGILRVKRQAL